MNERTARVGRRQWQALQVAASAEGRPVPVRALMDAIDGAVTESIRRETVSRLLLQRLIILDESTPDVPITAHHLVKITRWGEAARLDAPGRRGAPRQR